MPRYPGVTSALGCVIADMRQDFVQTLGAMLDGLALDALTAQMQAHLDEGHRVLDASGSEFEARETKFELDMAYLGQTHTVAVPIPVEVSGKSAKPVTTDAIRAAFEATYRGLYGRLLRNPINS